MQATSGVACHNEEADRQLTFARVVQASLFMRVAGFGS
jgi:hypothetical protein